MSEANGLWVMLSLTYERHNLGLSRKLWNTIRKKKRWGYWKIAEVLPDILNYLGRLMDHLYENIIPNKVVPLDMINQSGK